jgi:RNA polymerase sigma-70 factor (ECF subfamily)
MGEDQLHTTERDPASSAGTAVLQFPTGALPQRSANEGVLARLYAEHYEPLHAYASHYVDQDEADDVVQRAFIELWRRRDLAKDAPEVEYGPMLFRTVRFRIFDYNRNASVRKTLLAEFVSDFTDRVRGWMHPDDRVEQSALSLAISGAVKGMSPRVREVYAMHHEAGMTVNEVSRLTGVGRAGVRALVTRGNRILRDHLERAGFGTGGRS